MQDDIDHRILSKTAYEYLVTAVGKMLEEGKKANKQADNSLAKIKGRSWFLHDDDPNSGAEFF